MMHLLRYFTFRTEPVKLAHGELISNHVAVGVRIHAPLSILDVLECQYAHRRGGDVKAHRGRHASCGDHLKVTWNPTTHCIETVWKNKASFPVSIVDFACDLDMLPLYPDTFTRVMEYVRNPRAQINNEHWRVLYTPEEKA